jgi:hypothetical protein
MRDKKATDDDLTWFPREPRMLARGSLLRAHRNQEVANTSIGGRNVATKSF